MSKRKSNFYTYAKLSTLPIKVRMTYVQYLLNKLGYDIIVTSRKDKKLIKAIMDFQEKNGITANGVICPRTYETMINTLISNGEV